MNLKELYNICATLSSTTKRTEKEYILSKYINDSDFKRFLIFLFDTNIITGISTKKLKKTILIESNIIFDSIFSLMDYLKDNNTGRDIDIKIVQDSVVYMKNLIEIPNNWVVDFIYDICSKSLRLGIDAKTINKVAGYELIPQFNVMLGTSIEKCNIPENTWFNISQKLNGVRCLYIDGKLYSRSSKEYTGCSHIIEDIKKLEVLSGNKLVLDGELVLKDRSIGDSESFQIGVGLANSDAEDKSSLMLIIFDILSEEEFLNKESKLSYKQRKSLLLNLKQLISTNNLNNIDIIRSFYSGTNQNKIWEYLEYAENNDMEGIMLNLDTPYEFKRTKNLIKVKKFYDIDLKCIRVIQGDKGKYKNTLGAIECQYGNDTVKVGSGFSEELRDYYYNNTDKIINKIVSVKYKEKTTNKNGTNSLQFPVFLCVREDKTEPDNI